MRFTYRVDSSRIAFLSTFTPSCLASYSPLAAHPLPSLSLPFLSLLSLCVAQVVNKSHAKSDKLPQADADRLSRKLLPTFRRDQEMPSHASVSLFYFCCCCCCCCISCNALSANKINSNCISNSDAEFLLFYGCYTMP